MCQKTPSEVRHYEKSLMKIKKTWKNFYYKRITPQILGNGTFILLFSKVPNHPTQSDTLPSHSSSHNLVTATKKH